MSSTWQAANPEKWREYKRAYYARNKSAIAANKKAWAGRHKERLQAERRARSHEAAQWRAENRDRLRPNELLRNARRRAKRDGIEFTISLSDIQIPEKCPLLGVTLAAGYGCMCPTSPTLDRKDNTRGYVPGNVWVVSYRANAAKGDLNADELIAMGMRLKATLAEGASVQRRGAAKLLEGPTTRPTSGDTHG